MFYDGPKTKEEQRADFIAAAVMLLIVGVVCAAQLSGAIAIRGLGFSPVELAVGAVAPSMLSGFMLGHHFARRR